MQRFVLHCFEMDSHRSYGDNDAPRRIWCALAIIQDCGFASFLHFGVVSACVRERLVARVNCAQESQKYDLRNGVYFAVHLIDFSLVRVDSVVLQVCIFKLTNS